MDPNIYRKSSDTSRLVPIRRRNCLVLVYRVCTPLIHLFLAADDRGRLWVESTSEGGFLLSVFGPDGSLLAEGSAPARDQSVAPYVRDDVLYLATRDELGVQTIRMYRITIGSP